METLQRAANRGSISTGYDIDNSLKFESDNGEICKMNFSTGGSNQIFTWSFWCKRTELSTLAIVMGNGVSGNDAVYCEFSSDALRIVSTSSASFQCNLITDRLFRDTSAWYHIVVAFDTTQATSSDRVKLYVNGVQETSFSTATYPSLNDNTFMGNGTGQVQVGSINSSGSSYNGYLTEVFCIEGQQLAATDFGEFDTNTGIWKPIEYTGTFGTNYAFYLKFDNVASLGADSSGLGNNFTLTNITSIDQATDTPTNNFCTLNPLIYYGYGCTISQGALKAVDNSVGLGGAAGTVAVNKGKWYWEFQTNGANTYIGVQDIEADTTAAQNANLTAYTMGLYLLGEYNYVYDSGGTRNDGAVSGFVHANANWYGIALNMDDNEIEYYVNGVQKGPTFSLDELSDLYLRPFVSSSSSILYFNFGGLYPDPISTGNTDENGYGNFEYAPPSGYYAICSKNLAEFG